MKLRTILVILISIFFVATPALAAEQTPSGTVKIESTSVAAGVGVQWGDGMLTFEGKDYKFSVKGLNAGIALGIAKIKAEGEVFNLKKVSDLSGTYTALESGVAIVKGFPSGLTLESTKGVVINLKSEEKGIRLNATLGGVRIKLK